MGCPHDYELVVDEFVRSKAAREYLNGRVVVTLSSLATDRVVCLMRCQRKRDEFSRVDQNSTNDQV